ncbi:DUF4350 domain-containing protein [bacterium SCSIO 12741]|nr:DUF4350 domain-containing protein [bacterium SCSIO 12741]
MNNNSIVVVLLVTVVGLLAGAFYFVSQYIPDHDWSVHYNRYSDQPYGTTLFRELLEAHDYDFDYISYSRDSGYVIDTPSQATILFIGDYIYCDSSKAAELKKLVNAGAHVLVASEMFNRNLTRSFSENYELKAPLKDHELPEVTMYLSSGDGSDYEYHHKMLKDTVDFNWIHIDPAYFKDTLQPEGWTVQGTIDNNLPNFVSIDYGKGAFYQHLTPLVFTNYHLIRPDGFKYVRTLLKQFPGKKVYWIDNRTNAASSSDPFSQSTKRQTPLQFIMSNRSLRWGWYTLAGGVLLFLLFNFKRKQRAMRVINPPVNSSVYYAKTVGQLFYENGDPRHMAAQLMDLFHAYVLRRYRIQRTKDDDLYKQEIAKYSELDPEFINELFDKGFKMRYNELSTNKDLVELHRKLELFYKKCR